MIQTEGLLVDLVAAESFHADDPILIRCQVSNTAKEPRIFCIYHTPFEGILNDIFEGMTDEGAKIIYRGEMVKRIAPAPEHFLTLAPGETRTAVVNLRMGYDLPAGVIRVRFPGNAVSGLPPSAPLTFRIE